MRTKHLILILIGVIIATIVFIAFGPAGEPNDSFKNIVVHTHQQLKEFQVSHQATISSGVWGGRAPISIDSPPHPKPDSMA